MNPLIKDLLREIKRSFGRFFAIFAISVIGVAFFAGVTASPNDMRYSADKYFDDNNLMDIRLISEDGFSDEEINDISKMDGIDKVYTTNEFDTLTYIDNKQVVIKLTGYNTSADVNKLILVEGRMPETSDECVISYDKFDKYGMKPGDTLDVAMPTEGLIDYMVKNSNLKIVGIVKNSYYLSYDIGSSTLGDGSVGLCAYVSDDNFLLPQKNTMFITVNGAKELNSYKDEYFEVIKPVKNRIKEYFEENNHNCYVLDRNEHYSYVDYGGAADRIEAIAKVFPLFFIIVAVLVCLTTMTRMVDENRGVIGTYKALGYSNFKISQKYIVYSMSASILGGITGAFIGMKVFPLVIYNSWNIMYVMPEITYEKQYGIMLLSIICVTAAIVIATIFACLSELIETPALLMRPKAPTNGKNILLQKIPFIWNRMSFTKKVTARNIFRYKKRFLMTVIGISGCTALLITGFGIHDSISGLIKNQFEIIFKYDAMVSYSSENVIDKLEDSETVAALLDITKLNTTFSCNDEKEDGSLYVLEPDNYNKFITLKKRASKKEYSLKNEGAIITEKLSNDLNISKGDYISVKIGDKDCSFKVTDICEMYVGHYVFISPDAYKEAAGEDNINNLMLIQFAKNKNRYDFVSEFSDMAGIDSITLTEGLSEKFDNMISALGLVTVVLIIASGALAFVVLYNLTNVNISERLREIATIKVLGFYDNEVAAYVYRENIILTLVGGLTGLALGVGLHAFIMKVIELDAIMFGRHIDVSSFLLSYAITIMFSLLVNAVMYKKLKNIPMVESLKSVE